MYHSNHRGKIPQSSPPPPPACRSILILVSEVCYSVLLLSDFGPDSKPKSKLLRSSTTSTLAIFMSGGGGRTGEKLVHIMQHSDLLCAQGSLLVASGVLQVVPGTNTGQTLKARGCLSNPRLSFHVFSSSQGSWHYSFGGNSFECAFFWYSGIFRYATAKFGVNNAFQMVF